MKILSRRSGFSLVELLTVIAIIAILAAIIFPVMGVVKDKARQSECMTNMHQITMALQLFKQDNRKYPTVLSTAALDSSGNQGSPGNTVSFEQAKDGTGLFPEYAKSSIKLFHCSTSKITNTTDLVEIDAFPDGAKLSKPVYCYAYDSYMCYVSGTPSGGVYSGTSQVSQHYTTSWATSDGANGTNTVDSYPADKDFVASSDTALKQIDYERQLKFRNPPGDTVVTWCSNHETITSAGVSGNALIAYLDGHVENRPGGVVENSRWRTHPKK